MASEMREYTKDELKYISPIEHYLNEQEGYGLITEHTGFAKIARYLILIFSFGNFDIGYTNVFPAEEIEG